MVEEIKVILDDISFRQLKSNLVTEIGFSNQNQLKKKNLVCNQSKTQQYEITRREDQTWETCEYL